MGGLIGFIILLVVVFLLLTYWYLLIPFAIFFVAWKIYEIVYYKSQLFLAVKERVESYIKDCNDLNQHIEEMKTSGVITHRLDYGNASYQDASKWNYSRSKLKSIHYAPNIYHCSRIVCDNARKKPFEYICKYFGIKATEETLSEFENVLNNFEAVEDGKAALQSERKNIIAGIQTDIPWPIQKFGQKKFEQKLGFEDVDMSTAYFPQYVFKYVSSGGNASTQCTITMDIDNLNRFVVFLSEEIKFKKSVAGQRALMTSRLRQRIKERDGFTCKKCGASTAKEPNLLLEIDHVIPLAKGGVTTEDNLQTLCWRCNRSKGAKIQ